MYPAPTRTLPARDASQDGRTCIGRARSGVPVWNIAAEEERVVARHTLRLLDGKSAVACA